MAVMLTQWSPVPWSGETVSRLPLPPPSEGAAPTPIYESLLHEWSRAGRTVPGQAWNGRAEPPESPGRWWRTDDSYRPYGSPAPSVPPPGPAVPGPAPAAPSEHATYGGGSYGGQSRPYGSASSYGSVSPYVSGYGDGDSEQYDEGYGTGTGTEAGPEPRTAQQGGAALPAQAGAATQPRSAASDAPQAPHAPEAPAAEPAPKKPAWERVAIL